ncbi:MAG: hypothetical protein ACT4P1_02165 [Sporichthyaceae bacterium]
MNPTTPARAALAASTHLTEAEVDLIQADSDLATHSFPFRFTLAHRALALAWGVRPATALLEVDAHALRVRFGPWRLRTPLANIAAVQVTGPYSTLKTAGPARLSLADRGITLATNAECGVCIGFREPVPGLEPTGLLKHPALTVTVADPEGLAALLERHCSAL